MQIPPTVSFQDLFRSPELEAEVLARARKLERFYDRITSCHVVLTGPPPRHRHGGAIDVRIDLQVPGQTIVVGRESPDDPRHANAQLAVRDAFKAVRRELQDHVRRARGQVKAHESDRTEPTASSFSREVEIPVDEHRLRGVLAIPARARGLVIFAHGSGSSRLSPRNLAVARDLGASGLGTLLFDLLTDAEAADRSNVFDVRFLATRLAAATAWIQNYAPARGLPVGYFGASTGAAAALIAAADDASVKAVVSRGGRPDLAEDVLPFVGAPTLLVVGGADEAVLKHNRRAFVFLRGIKELAVVPRAGHLFEEPGAMEAVVLRAREWFLRHLPARGA